jgi:signal transduction histidine kinase
MTYSRLQKHDLFVWGVLALLYFLCGKLSLYLSVENSIVTLAIFFAEGVSLAAVLIYGKKVWPGIFIGQLLLALSSGIDMGAALGISAVNSAEAVIVYYLFSRIRFSRELYRLHDLYLLFGGILLVLQPFSALLGNLILVVSGVNDMQSFLPNLFSWWFGNSMGQMLLTPILLILYRDRGTIRYLLFGVVVFVFLLFGYLVFFVTPVENLSLLMGMTIPVVVLVMLYIGLVYAMVCVFLLSLLALYATHLGIGAFTSASSTDNLININFYIFAHIFVLYVYGILVTEKDRALKALAEMNERLEERVREEIGKRQEKEKLLLLRSRQAQMGEMISMIAHQWRQPLNTLSLMLQKYYIRYQLKKIDEEAMKRMKDDMQSLLDQMSETINDFRDFFNPGKEKSYFNPAHTVRYIVSMLDPLYEHENIQIQTELEEDIRIYGYPNEFAQVLLNIINNAKDAIMQSDRQVPRRITVRMTCRDGYMTLTVEDRAGGISEEIIGKIFDPYFSTKLEKNGTGLGLYMSRMIIEEHMDGELQVTNHQGGARFEITLCCSDV